MDRPNATESNPFGFKDIAEATDALHDEVFHFYKRIERLQQIAITIKALSLGAAAGEAEGLSIDADAYLYLSERLDEAVAGIDGWHDRAHPLAVVVQKQDLGALTKFPHLLEKIWTKPDAVEPEAEGAAS